MKTLFNGRLWVHYGQAYVVSGPVFDSDFEASFRGQSNGLCGASSPNLLFLITGLHTGHVNFSVEFSDAEPPLDRAWEDVVEVSSTVVNRPFLKEWAGQVLYPIDLAPGTYRVRYAARGMDAARAVDTIVETEEPPTPISSASGPLRAMRPTAWFARRAKPQPTGMAGPTRSIPQVEGRWVGMVSDSGPQRERGGPFPLARWPCRN